jgi:leucyl-tRNA synthetase
VHRFLARLWRIGLEAAADGTGVAPLDAVALAGADLALARKAHWAIEKVTNDMAGRFAFNTAIAAVMELVNTIYQHSGASREARRYATASAASLLFPFAPHLGSEVYELITGRRVWEQPWPDVDTAMLQSDTFELVCQINGKVRDRVSAATGSPKEELERLCLESRGVQAHIDGHEIAKVIVVPDKLVNLVVR